uniref:Selenocysteine lyase n=1 Tax=Parascaris univalens TaxID=6257 RepID=A0A914ZL15_PARUN
MLANNETGVIQPLAQIADIARKAGERYDSRVLVHTDAAQAVGKVDVDPDVLKTDFVTVVGHKFYGPRIGALVIRSEKTVPLQSLFRGGSQEHGKRAGFVFSNSPSLFASVESSSTAAVSLQFMGSV